MGTSLQTYSLWLSGMSISTMERANGFVHTRTYVTYLKDLHDDCGEHLFQDFYHKAEPQKWALKMAYLRPKKIK